MTEQNYRKLAELTALKLADKLNRPVAYHTTSLINGSMFIFKFREEFVFEDVKLTEFTRQVKVPVYYDDNTKKIEVSFGRIVFENMFDESFYFNLDYFLRASKDKLLPKILEVGNYELEDGQTIISISFKPFPHGFSIYRAELSYSITENGLSFDKTHSNFEKFSKKGCLIIRHRKREYKTIKRAVDSIVNVILDINESLLFLDNDDLFGKLSHLWEYLSDREPIFCCKEIYDRRYEIFKHPEIKELSNPYRIKLRQWKQLTIPGL